MSQQRIGRYQILEEIASGGQATVHRVWDTQTGGILALKVMHPHLTRDNSYIERFRREAAIASALNHPNITRVFEIGQEGDTHFMSMEYLPLSLHYLIQSQGKLPVDRAVHIAYQICQGMQIAHEHRTFHRDIKPQNILLAPDGTPKITDFGIARAADLSTMTRTGMVMGTPHYMSPEQTDGRADIRSDIYSMGIVLYQMLTGDLPFSAETPWEIIRLHREAKPTSLRKVVPNLPRGLDTVVARCLEKDPNRRYQTPALMAHALQQVLPSVVTSTTQPQAITPSQTQQPAPQTTTPKTPTNASVCVKCGAKLEPGQRYCTACGTAVTGPSLAPAPSTPTPTPPRPAPAAQPRPPAPAPGPSTIVRAWEARRRGPAWARLLALTALVAVVGGAIYLALRPPPAEPVIEPPGITGPVVGTVGEVIWEIPAVFQPLAVGPEGELYVAEESGEIHSFGPDGAERWRFNAGSNISDATLGADGLLYVTTHNGNLLAFDQDGSVHSERGTLGSSLFTASGAQGELYTLSTEGMLWRVPEQGRPLWSLNLGGQVLAAPVVGPDGTVYVGTVDPGAIHAVSPDGEELWREEIGPVEVSPALGSVYVATADGFLYAFNEDGSYRWDGEIFSPPSAPPVIPRDGAIYVLSSAGDLFRFTDFGSLDWSVTINLPAQDGLVVDPDGTAYVLSQEGTVWAVDRNGNANQFFHDPDATWLAASPRGLVYVGGTNGLTALKPVREVQPSPIAAPTATLTPSDRPPPHPRQRPQQRLLLSHRSPHPRQYPQQRPSLPSRSTVACCAWQ